MKFNKITFILIFSFSLTQSYAQIPIELYQLLENKDTTELYFGAEIDPEFPGGRTELIKHYKKHLYYPFSARAKGIEGTVYMMFIVEKNGELTNIMPTNSVDKQLDRIATKLIKKMPNWIPGRQDNKIVRVLHIQPVNFVLE